MDIHIRKANPADADAIARVDVDAWRTTYTDIVPAEYLAHLSYQVSESRWGEVLAADQPVTSNFVAETDNGEVVGFAGGGPEREGNPIYRGELYAIYLLKEYQRKGVGRRLVLAVAQYLMKEGFNSMLLWVLADNHPGRRFYESLGGTPVSRKTVTIGGADLVEMSYGWRSIADLVVERAV